MEGYTGYTYPESGNSSPHSRDVDFDNQPQSWEDQPPQPLPPNHKVKFLVSYGGKIQPRPHDNQLSYIGGETKILAVDRSIKFSTLLSKLSSLLSQDLTFNPLPVTLTSFKYQLPDEELDALISVTNDDDLEHMMHEYDRLFRASPRPARLRLFAFPGPQPGFGSTGSEPGKVFADTTNPVPVPGSGPGPVLGQDHHGPRSKVDFLFGLENRVAGPGPGYSERVSGSDPEIDLGRLHISNQENRQPVQQKPAPTIPASQWKPQQVENQPLPPPQQQNQPVYVMHAPPRAEGLFHAPPHGDGMIHAQVSSGGGLHATPHGEGMFHAPGSSGGGFHMPVSSGGGFHAPMMRPVAGQPIQGYYQIQRVPSDAAAGVYREQPVMHAGGPGMGVQVRPVTGIEENNNNRGGGYHIAYDSASGRQIYYSAPPGIMTAPFHGVGGGQSQTTSGEGKVVHHKISQTSTHL